MDEETLIKQLLAKVPVEHPRLTVSAGDDAAVWEWDENYFGLFSVDTLHDFFDFDKVYHAPPYIGYKAVTTAISDICAMNGEPLFISVALGVPKGVSATYLEGIYEGIGKAARKYGVAVMGGDISMSTALWLSVGVVGRVEKRRLARRKGARPKEVLCVTGDLGGAYAGLKILQREKAVYLSNPNLQPDVQEYNYIISRQIKPEARIDVVRLFREVEVVPSSIVDLSDGLAKGLYAMAEASGVGLRVFLDRLPYHPQTKKVAELLDHPITPYLLYGGEEYELLFTLPVLDYPKVEGQLGITAIGFVSEEAGIWADDGTGHWQKVEKGGWDSAKGSQNVGAISGLT
jgi:thiamine-monophosphate kinase